MQETTAPGKDKRPVTSRPVQTTSPHSKQTPADTDQPPLKRRNPEDLFESAAGGSRELHMLLSELAEVLSESAAADRARMEELEGILAEAKNLESFLKEKKQHLKQTLALISDKLLS